MPRFKTVGTYGGSCLFYAGASQLQARGPVTVARLFLQNEATTPTDPLYIALFDLPFGTIVLPWLGVDPDELAKHVRWIEPHFKNSSRTLTFDGEELVFRKGLIIGAFTSFLPPDFDTNSNWYGAELRASITGDIETISSYP